MLQALWLWDRHARTALWATILPHRLPAGAGRSFRTSPHCRGLLSTSIRREQPRRCIAASPLTSGAHCGLTRAGHEDPHVLGLQCPCIHTSHRTNLSSRPYNVQRSMYSPSGPP